MDVIRVTRDLMLANSRSTGTYQYTLPSPDSYPYQWLWDSCFHALIYLNLGNPDRAKQEILSFISKQFDNGLIPHIIYWDKNNPSNFPGIDWGKTDTSSLTQPPLPAYVVKRIFDGDHDIEFLKSVYQSLIRYYKYLLTLRDAHGNHLVSIINPDESGEDNSPRFDPPLGLPPQHSGDENWHRRLNLIAKNVGCSFEEKACMRNFFWVKDVPFNSVLVMNLDCLASLAQKLNHPDDVAYLTDQKQQVSQAMRRFMFADGIFWSVYGNDYKLIRTETWAIFAPLIANLYSPDEAQILVTNYFSSSSHFQTPYLVPSVSVSDPAYDPQGFWRGPIWMAVNWFIYQGFTRYHLYKQAEQIRNSSLSLLEKSGFREQYHPHTGAGLGAKNFTWGGLVLDMIPF